MPYLPHHWDPTVSYTENNRNFQVLKPDALAFVLGPQNPKLSSASFPSNRAQSVLIKKITDAAHPAHGQRGLFADRKIQPRTHILFYFGELHCDDRPDSNYDLCLHRFNDGTSLAIDASIIGNEARFINDYRGTQFTKPNAEFVDVRTSGELRISVCSLNQIIRKGEEIVVSYGKSWWAERMQSAVETTVE